MAWQLGMLVNRVVTCGEYVCDVPETRLVLLLCHEPCQHKIYPYPFVLPRYVWRNEDKFVSFKSYIFSYALGNKNKA